MGSIPKIVSTPVKWASRKIIHQTLLRFPGGNAHDPMACTYCPELCRFSCPSAVISGNDAVTPSNKMSLLHQESRWPGRAANGGELWPLYDCTGCGRCTEHCVYGVPVADQLFEARSQHSFKKAREAALGFTDEQDPFGDIAEELGDEASAARRFEAVRAKAQHSVVEHPEARVVYFLGKRGVSAALSWQWVFLADADHPVWKTLAERLTGRTWILYESSWLNRRLGRTAQTDLLVRRLESAGISILRAFAHGKDCIDGGGETPGYIALQPQQAAEMAAEWWARDAHRAQGILSMSSRATQHFRSHLNAIEVFDLPQFLEIEFQPKKDV
jgi:ferredoxin